LKKNWDNDTIEIDKKSTCNFIKEEQYEQRTIAAGKVLDRTGTGALRQLLAEERHGSRIRRCVHLP